MTASLRLLSVPNYVADALRAAAEWADELKLCTPTVRRIKAVEWVLSRGGERASQ